MLLVLLVLCGKRDRKEIQHSTIGSVVLCNVGSSAWRLRKLSMVVTSRAEPRWGGGGVSACVDVEMGPAPWRMDCVPSEFGRNRSVWRLVKHGLFSFSQSVHVIVL